MDSLLELFCDVDEFCRAFLPACSKTGIPESRARRVIVSVFALQRIPLQGEFLISGNQPKCVRTLDLYFSSACTMACSRDNRCPSSQSVPKRVPSSDRSVLNVLSYSA